ncbi:metalloendopeptidase [Saxophila tyrrhenica]|uniref:Metalloendopeptidase n=1 Tax=Saxophila tyrrhenica TaxID=1690608 RepID=A0AAV9PS72_9PEZI|nr:metalloendopeptidase [Saxophila tyrrhenica]
MWFKDPLFYFHIAGVAGLFGLYYLYNLERVPVTYRWRFNTVSEFHENQFAERVHLETVEARGDSILPRTSKEHVAVQRIFDHLLPAAGLSDTEWELHVIDDPDTTNAFALPGGKVFVYTGLLDFCTSDDELASILGHEIAHTICRHGMESLSRFLLWLPLYVISCVASGLDPDLVALAVNVAFRYPNSRTQEAEADYIGMLLMAEAGYDPSAALDCWRRMEEQEAGTGVSYKSTHPGHHN